MKHSTTRYARTRTYARNNKLSRIMPRKGMMARESPIENDMIRRLGITPITKHADNRHNSCSMGDSKCADHANAWSPPYTNAAALKPTPIEAGRKTSDRHRMLNA